jgi:hypothetical protein
MACERRADPAKRTPHPEASPFIPVSHLYSREIAPKSRKLFSGAAGNSRPGRAMK